jgi:hypothetical protein
MRTRMSIMRVLWLVVKNVGGLRERLGLEEKREIEIEIVWVWLYRKRL